MPLKVKITRNSLGFEITDTTINLDQLFSDCTEIVYSNLDPDDLAHAVGLLSFITETPEVFKRNVRVVENGDDIASVIVPIPILIAYLASIQRISGGNLKDINQSVDQLLTKCLTALKRVSEPVHGKVCEWMLNQDDLTSEYHYNILTGITYTHYAENLIAKNRIIKLPDVLDMFKCKSHHYQSMLANVSEYAVANNCDPFGVSFELESTWIEKLQDGIKRW